MCKVAEAAYEASLFAEQEPPDEILVRAIERLDLLGAERGIPELTKIAYGLRSLIGPLKCRWCGQTIVGARWYFGLGAVFCSTTCREEALTPPVEEPSRDVHPA